MLIYDEYSVTLDDKSELKKKKKPKTTYFLFFTLTRRSGTEIKLQSIL